MRIVGEKGEDGAWTDYSFGISAKITTASAYVAPSDVTSWFDGPLATTSAKPYLWMKVQKYSDATTTADNPQYCRLTGEKGDDGTSVNIKGSVDYYKSSVSGYVPSDGETWAVDNGGTINGTVIPGHCVVYYDGESVQYTVPKAGDGYLVNSSFEEKGEYEGHLLVSDDTKWIDAGNIQGPAGSDGAPGTNGKTTYVHFAYANSEDGTQDFTTDDSKASERLYQGVYTDFVQADSTTPSKYTWHKQTGEDVIVLKATPDRFSFPADTNGIHINDSASNEVNLILYRGGTPIPCTNYTLQYRSADHDTWTEDYEELTKDIAITDSLERSDEVTVTVTIEIDSASWANDNAWTEYKATYNGNEYITRVDWIGVRAGKDGEPGTPGADGKQIVYNIRKFSDYSVGQKFRDGTQDEVPCVLDVVIDDSGNYYKCIKAYTLTNKSTQGPTNTTYWEKFETFTNIATDLVLAKKAYIQNLLLNYATAVNRTTNTTTISIDGDTGILTANGLQARNATVSGSIEANTIGYSINTPQAVTYKQPTEDNATWIPATLPNGSGTQCAAQVLACNSSVYVMPQVLISSEPDVDDVWEAWSGNCVTYVILPPTKVGKIALDIYFRNEITDWDGYNTDTVYYLAVMNPTISKSYIEDGAYAKSVISNLTSYYPSLVDLQSAGSTRRVTTKNYIILTEKYNNGDIVTCDRPSHIKLMSDGTNWYIVQVDEFDK